MSRRVGLLVLTAAGLALAGSWLLRPQPLSETALPDHRADPGRGETWFHAGGCASCHGPDLAGGLEMKTAFGLFRVPNISAHVEDGIGRWTLLDFVNAMRRGVSPAGRHYYPAFPWASYARMQTADVLDLKAYLDTRPAVPGRIADHDLRFPWNLRAGIGLWKRLYFDSAPVLQIAAGDAELQRGRYLVEGPGHCGECHTPRDRLGGPDHSRWLAGAAEAGGEGRVPNITPHADGLESWSQADIAWYLESGFTPDFDTAGGAMVDVQENLAHLPKADLRAIAAYLKAIPPLPDPEG